MLNRINSHFEIKDIPNLLNIEYESRPDNFVELLLFNYSNRIKSGYTRFHTWEFDEFCAILLSKVKEENMNKNILEYCYINSESKIIKDEINYHLLRFKYLKKEISKEERVKLYELLSVKKKKIRSIFLKEINDAGIGKKKINLFEAELTELTSIAGYFESQTLLPWFVPIYLDLEMLLHIYIRHTRETFLDKSNYKGRTLFKYKLADIKTLLKCVMQVVENEIKEHFVYVATGDTNKDFHKAKILYNEDYYQLRINANGRIMQFHQLG